MFPTTITCPEHGKVEAMVIISGTHVEVTCTIDACEYGYKERMD